MHEEGEMDPSRSDDEILTLRDLACTHYASKAQIRIGARAAKAFAALSREALAAWPEDSWLSGSSAGRLQERREAGHRATRPTARTTDAQVALQLDAQPEGARAAPLAESLSLYDWFWQKEELLLANLPDVTYGQTELSQSGSCESRSQRRMQEQAARGSRPHVAGRPPSAFLRGVPSRVAISY